MNSFFRHSIIGLAVFAGAFVLANAAQHVATQQGWLPIQGHGQGLPAVRIPHLVMPAADALPAAPAGARPRHDSTPLRHLVHLPGGGRVVDTPVAPWTVSAPYIRTALLVDGVAQPVHGDSLALPSGSRFRLSVTSGEAAYVEVHAVSPQGQASDGPLWSGQVNAHASAMTPYLRLQGTRGLETLRVVRTSLTNGTSTEQQVQVWHE